MVHQTAYDFNDDLLPNVASVFARIVEAKLS
jgi:hippurate hydrolase